MKTRSIPKQTVNCPLIPLIQGPHWLHGDFTALFTNMRTLKFKSHLHNCVYRCRQSWLRSQATNLETEKHTKRIEIHKSQTMTFWTREVKFCFLRGPLRWLTAAKNAIVGWVLNSRIRMFVKSAILICGPQSTWKRTIFSTRRKTFSFKIFLMVFFSNLKE